MRGRVVVVLAALLASPVAAIAVAAPARSATTAPKWSVAPTPSPPTEGVGSLTGVVCPTASSCLAAGNNTNIIGDPSPLVGNWNGTSGSEILAPVPPPAPHATQRAVGSLRGVACASVTTCFAVGSYTDGTQLRTLIERWNGTTWSLAARLTPSGATASTLSAISCPTGTSCIAVGSSSVKSHSQPLTERWNQKTWSIVATPALSAGTTGALSAISCTSVTNCLAVGSTQRSSKNTALAEGWNGKLWSVMATAAIAGALSGVSCVTGSSCFAVGANKNVTLIERFKGTSWSRVASPSPVHINAVVLNGVSCPALTACFAVGGSVVASGAEQPLLLRWNGTRWSTASGTDPGAALLAGISCRSAASCVAVSYFTPHVQRWDGAKWSVFHIGGSFSQLSGVSCASPTSCFATGMYSDADTGNSTNLLEQWNGTTWSVVPAAVLTGADNAVLSAVSCISNTSCFAVGTQSLGATQRTLIERWDGTVWSVLPSVDPSGTSFDGLARVSCVSATRCFAVGNADFSSTFIEQWDGTSWSLVASPSLTNAEFTSISCQSASSCFAVGYTQPGSGLARDTPLIERWDGETWSLVPSPSSTDSRELQGVSCAPGGTACLAVGVDFADAGTLPLAEQWNGTSWSVVVSPDDVDYFVDVSCAGDTSCFATASAKTTGRPLVERWGGTAWSSTPVPLPAIAAFGMLAGVSCVSSSCFAVGSVTTPLESHFTLVERYS